MDELPVLATLEEEFASENLAVVTICVGSSAARARSALQEANVGLLTLVDERRETMISYRAVRTPITYLIGSDGVILMSDVGYGDDTEEYLRSQIQRLLRD